MISETAKVYPNVILGDNVTIEDHCIVGLPTKNTPQDCQTVIGDNAVIRAQTIIYAGNQIGDNFQTGNKANIRENNRIGSNVSIGTLSVVEHHVTIEDHVRIHTQAFIPEYSTLEEGCWLGPNVVLTNSKYPNQPDSKDQLAGPIIGKKAIVGANATLLPGVQLGDQCLVGAGAVVVKNVGAGETVVGNPAQVIKRTL